MKSYLLKIRGGVEVDSAGRKAGKGPLIAEEISNTLGTNQDQYLFQPLAIENHPADSRVKFDESGKVQTLTGRMGTGGGNIPMILEPIVYGISSYASNAMLSDNPHSGIYEAKTARTLDLNGGNPACNQGGMIVLEGNGARPSHQGDGYAESETMYTLNTIEKHAVCYSVDEKMGSTYIHEDKANTLAARDYKMPQAVCYWDGGQVAGTLTAQNSGGGQRMPDKGNFTCVIVSKGDRASDGEQSSR